AVQDDIELGAIGLPGIPHGLPVLCPALPEPPLGHGGLIATPVVQIDAVRRAESDRRARVQVAHDRNYDRLLFRLLRHPRPLFEERGRLRPADPTRVPPRNRLAPVRTVPER